MRLPVELRGQKVHQSGIIVPSSTLENVMRRIGDGKITVENSFSKTKKGLISTELVQELQDTIRKRDEIINRVNQKMPFS